MAMDLGDVFNSLNQEHFANLLPQPRLDWNSRLRSSAGRFCPGSRNPFRPREPYIEIASYLLGIPDGALHVRDTMLHELIHYSLWFQKKPYGHTPEFHAILKKVGARRYNPVPKETSVKYWYECPKCNTQTPARRRLSQVACLTCCKKWNKGKYSENFRLFETKRRAENPPAQQAAPVSPALPVKQEKILPFSEVVRRLDELRASLKGFSR